MHCSISGRHTYRQHHQAAQRLEPIVYIQCPLRVSRSVHWWRLLRERDITQLVRPFQTVLCSMRTSLIVVYKKKSQQQGSCYISRYSRVFHSSSALKFTLVVCSSKGGVFSSSWGANTPMQVICTISAEYQLITIPLEVMASTFFWTIYDSSGQEIIFSCTRARYMTFYLYEIFTRSQYTDRIFALQVLFSLQIEFLHN